MFHERRRRPDGRRVGVPAQVDPGIAAGDDVTTAKFRDAGYDRDDRQGNARPRSNPRRGACSTLPPRQHGRGSTAASKGTASGSPTSPISWTWSGALDVLSRHEGASCSWSPLIDKSHPLDWERAVMDTIMLDRAVEVAGEFAARKDDMLIVTADHARHVDRGTVDDNAPGDVMAQGRRLRKAGSTIRRRTATAP
jgi:hypothetical protein